MSSRNISELLCFSVLYLQAKGAVRLGTCLRSARRMLHALMCKAPAAAAGPHSLQRTAEMPGTRPWYALGAPRPPGGAASQAATTAPALRSAAAQ